jgi:hypothetical protein
VNLSRAFSTGHVDASAAPGIVYLLGFTVVALPLAIRTMRRRLIK